MPSITTQLRVLYITHVFMQIRHMGRPKKDVSVDDIISLRQLNYNWKKISVLLQISRSTLYRRMEESGVSIDDYTKLSKTSLDKIVKDIKISHPKDGERLMQGHLSRLGLKVKRKDLRSSIHRVDPHGVEFRKQHAIKRRIYCVPHPNALWHLDSHHKLIRWRLVIHGAIDGFSRLVLYLECTNNNQATTVVSMFKKGVSHFGLPLQIRSDHGSENVDVWRFMIAAHNYDYSSVITGSSTHNQRIERLWRDVHRCVASIFSEMFYTLESEGLLDPLNETDLFCLHFIFLPRLNKCLVEFRESWNQHKLSTEGNLSPCQLFFEGKDYIMQTCNVDVQGSNVEVDMFEVTTVTVNRIAFTPCTELLQQLASIDPLQECEDNGKLLYVNTIHLIGRHLLLHCDNCTL